MNNYSQAINDQKGYISMLNNYEEMNLVNYVDGKEDKMVFGNSQSAETNSETVKKNCEKLVENMKNPFFNIYHWVKGETFDIEAVNNALATREYLLEKIGKNNKKVQSTQSDLDAAR